MVNIKLPKHVNDIIKKLNSYGYEAYAVGGCVRDCVLGVVPVDWDITTSALPEQVKALFYKTVDTGIKHGTVTVMMEKMSYEVTTYRIDGPYENNRSPKNVHFTRDLIEDLKRRDFTMNAMAYNEEEGLVDAFSGILSIENKVITCVGDPNERFQEDALRMLRAVRFSAKLGFDIDSGTQAAIKKNAHLIEKISGERVHMELTKILTSQNPHFIKKCVDLGLMAYTIPEFMDAVGLEQNNPHHIYTVDDHIYEALKNIEPTETLRWTMFLHDIGKGTTKTIDEKGKGHFYGHPEKSCLLAKEILHRLRFDNKTTKDILKLIECHDHRIEASMKTVRRTVQKIGEALFLDYIKVQEADVRAQNPVYLETYLPRLENIRKLFEEMQALGHCTTLKDLKINGKDLIEIGFDQGQNIGKILCQLLEFVIEEPSSNNEQWLLQKARELMIEAQ